MTIARTFKLEIDCDNAAFEDSTGREISRILRAALKRIEAGQYDYGVLMDVNGNKVGKWELEQ